jgi:DNA polymerase elongation subunit (family B)
MKLEFEEKAYTEFLILTKKRYAAFAMELGKSTKKLMKRGIVLTRRDNCNWLRLLYEKIMLDLLNNADDYSKLKDIQNDYHKEIYKNEKVKNLLYMILDTVNEMFQRKFETKEFVITKGMKQLEHKGKTDPVHIHVAKKMIKRGQPVQDGERIEYVLLDLGELKYKAKDKVLDKAEDANYYDQHKDVLNLDYLTYLQRQCVNPVDELLDVGIKLKRLLEEQFELRLQKKKYLNTINNVFSPRILKIE